MGDLNAYKSYHLSKLVGCSVVYNDSKQVSYQTVANNFDREDNIFYNYFYFIILSPPPPPGHHASLLHCLLMI